MVQDNINFVTSLYACLRNSSKVSINLFHLFLVVKINIIFENIPGEVFVDLPICNEMWQEYQDYRLYPGVSTTRICITNCVFSSSHKQLKLAAVKVFFESGPIECHISTLGYKKSTDQRSHVRITKGSRQKKSSQTRHCPKRMGGYLSILICVST